MANKKGVLPATTADSAVLPSPRSRREELLDALLGHTSNATHLRILEAYKASGTVAGAEQEFAKIIQEVIDEA
jgi:hypothetical protein